MEKKKKITCKFMTIDYSWMILKSYFNAVNPHKQNFLKNFLIIRQSGKVKWKSISVIKN